MSTKLSPCHVRDGLFVQQFVLPSSLVYRMLKDTPDYRPRVCRVSTLLRELLPLNLVHEKLSVYFPIVTCVALFPVENISRNSQCRDSIKTPAEDVKPNEMHVIRHLAITVHTKNICSTSCLENASSHIITVRRPTHFETRGDDPGANTSGSQMKAVEELDASRRVMDIS